VPSRSNLHSYRAAACNATQGIAVAILSVSLSLCLSVKCMYCDKTEWCTADILISHERAITLVFWHQQWLVGRLFPLKYLPKLTYPLRITPTSQHKHVLRLKYNNCRQLHNKLLGHRHVTPHWQQPHGLSAVAELLVNFWLLLTAERQNARMSEIKIVG